MSLYFLGKLVIIGTRLSQCGDKNPEENVAAEHENQADCFGNTDCLDPHHSPLCLQRFQLWKMSAVLQGPYILSSEFLQVIREILDILL